MNPNIYCPVERAVCPAEPQSCQQVCELMPPAPAQVAKVKRITPKHLPVAIEVSRHKRPWSPLRIAATGLLGWFLFAAAAGFIYQRFFN